GLQDDISRDVKSLDPGSLAKAVALAKLFEEKYSTNLKQKNYSTPTRNNSPYTQKPYQNSQKNDSPTKSPLPALLPTPSTKPFNNRNSNIKKLSPAEIQLRRDKGLCYFCDDKFSPSHKCPNRQFLMLQVEDTEESDAELTDNTETDNTGWSEDTHHLSLNAMGGSNGLGTIRFTGQIGSIRVHILVDGGSSDNFIQPRVAQTLKMDIEPAPNLKVLVGNGQMMTAEGKIQQLPLLVQGQEIKVKEDNQPLMLNYTI
ncbi:hypothetical protein A2U01_0023226, partial [Trifolium medium]|nr:hypothetical protein [Trifolium medium]